MSGPVKAVNDFVVKFANVNGSGSASANEMFARSLLRMGVPVASRNIFPSNIQGLPTWYEVRVSGHGWLGRRGGVDLMVAMNPQTWDKDIASIDTGGYLFYDSSRPIPPSKFRDDINVIRMPLTEICNAAYNDPRQRQLFKNIIYVGALAELLGIEEGVLQTLIGEQYKSKQALIAPNHQALKMGYDYAREHLKGLCGLKVERPDAVKDRIFVNGNDAAGLGCVYGGATVAAWYPITPSTSVAEAFAKHCKKYRVDQDNGQNKFAIVQSEDEISAIGAVIGAGWNGARAFTATIGPGHLADAGISGPGLFRGNSRRDHRCAAWRPFHRHAHPHPAGRPSYLRLCQPWRHQACAAVARKIPRSCSNSPPCPLIWRSGCRPRSSCWKTSTSA